MGLTVKCREKLRPLNSPPVQLSTFSTRNVVVLQVIDFFKRSGISTKFVEWDSQQRVGQSSGPSTKHLAVENYTYRILSECRLWASGYGAGIRMWGHRDRGHLIRDWNLNKILESVSRLWRDALTVMTLLCSGLRVCVSVPCNRLKLRPTQSKLRK